MIRLSVNLACHNVRCVRVFEMHSFGGLAMAISRQDAPADRRAPLARSPDGAAGRGHLRTKVGLEELPGSEFEMRAGLVLLAMGFVHPVHDGLIEQLGVELDPRGNVSADTRSFEASESGVFAAGDVRRGQSLVVWAQWEGREVARAVDQYLMGASRLQSRIAFV